MRELFIWLVIWFSAWGFFNISVRWFLEKYRLQKFGPRGVYFFLVFIVIYFVFNKYISYYSLQLLAGVLVTNSLGIIFGFEKFLYKKFQKDRYFLVFQTFNVLFQQTMIVIGINILREYFGLNYRDYYFAFAFLVAHSPIVFLPWASLKYQIMTITFFGGLLFSFLIKNYPYGLVLSFVIHFIVYIWMINRTKDEEKI